MGAIPLIAPDVLGDIIAAASDLSIVISDMGQILSVLVNPDHPSFGRLDDWIGRDIREVSTTESVPKFDARLADFVQISGSVRPLELNYQGISGMGFPVRYSFYRIGPDGAILMLGRDLRPIAEMQQQLVEARMVLESDYEAQRYIATRMSVLLETSREAMLFVRLSDGRIVDVNAPAARLLGVKAADLGGAIFIHELADGGIEDAMARLTAAARSERVGTVTVTSRRTSQLLRAEATLFRAAGERMMLCRLDPSQPAATGAQDGGPPLADFYDKSVDAMLFTDRSGTILSVNEAFLGMLDLENAATAKGRNLADFLLRGGLDLKVLTDNATRNGQVKLFVTRMVTNFGTEMPVEIAATCLSHEAEPAIGYVLRDASRLDGIRSGGARAVATRESARPANSSARRP